MWMWPALIVSILLGALGQILMKIAMKQAGPIPIDGPLLDLFSYFLHAGLSLPLFAAAVSYGISFLLWLAVLSVADLSLARPIMSAGYLLTLAYGIFAGEGVNATRIIGTLLIVVGIAFIVKSGLGRVSG
ncbi:MAG: hypothetical protein K8S54_01940 [Spirochaetia bacterium]|nr:hypothetical protein [Spirochaetia bacterium]